MSTSGLPKWLQGLDPAPFKWGGCGVLRARLPLWRLRGNTGQIQGVPANPRRWSATQLDSLRQSLRDTPELLAARALLVVPHGEQAVVIGGNMRLAAAKADGYEDLPCIVLPADTPPAKLKEIVLKDNGTFGEWNLPALLEDYPEFDLAACGIAVGGGDTGAEAEPSEDDFSQAVADTAPPVTKAGDLFALGDHLLMCADATNGEAVGFLAKAGPVDLLMTDPPYNVDYEGGTAAKLKIMNDRMDDTVFIEFLAAAFKAADSVMRKGAAFYLWHASSKAFCVHSACRDTGWEVKQELIWNKNSLVLGRQDYQWKHEPCLYGWKDGTHYFCDSRSETTVWDEEQPADFTRMSKPELVALLRELYSGDVSTTVVNEARPNASEDHPTMKPIRLIGRLVRNSTRKGERVLDLFGGSGSTLIACEQLGRKCLMMELDPHYCDVIITRWERLTGRKAVKMN